MLARLSKHVGARKLHAHADPGRRLSPSLTLQRLFLANETTGRPRATRAFYRTAGVTCRSPTRVNTALASDQWYPQVRFVASANMTSPED